MAIEIGGGILFGSMALIADGLHMSTHTAAFLIAAHAGCFSLQAQPATPPLLRATVIKFN